MSKDEQQKRGGFVPVGRRTRGRQKVSVKAGTGGRHDSTTASIEPHSGMNSRCRVTGVPHLKTTSKP